MIRPWPRSKSAKRATCSGSSSSTAVCAVRCCLSCCVCGIVLSGVTCAWCAGDLLQLARSQLGPGFGFRPGQQAIIEAVLSGKSAFAVFKTGWGKSLCFLLPCLVHRHRQPTRAPHILVVSPLLALIRSTDQAFTRMGLSSLMATSEYDWLGEYSVSRVRGGQVDAIITTPESFSAVAAKLGEVNACALRC